jgi:hypothetical protein
MNGRILSASTVLGACLIVVTGASADQRTFGKGISAQDTVLVSELLTHPEQFLDKTVRVQGTVVGVCKKRGCWIDLASDQEFQKINIKVEDGVIVFPPELMGESVIAEGTLTGMPLDHDQAVNYLKYEAECQGEAFEANAVPAEGITIYQIQAVGAVSVASTQPDEPAVENASDND